MKLLLIISLLFMTSCTTAQTTALKITIPAVVDKVVDAEYGLLCNLSYNVENRLLSRKQIAYETMKDFCKRIRER